MKLVLSIFIFVSFIMVGFSQIPSTDIYLADLVHKGNDVFIKNIQNITDRNGYDNQPQFSEDGNYIYFASDRDGSQTEIYKYDIRKKITERVTVTFQSEYSPTLIPGSNSLSVVRVESDSTHQLIKMESDGSRPVPLYEGNDKIGYHSWLEDNRIILFTLPAPHEIKLYNQSDKQNYLVAENGGRCMQKIPGENAVSFTVTIDSLNYQVRKFDGTLNKAEIITELLTGTEDYAWMNSNTMVSGNSGILYLYNLSNKEKGWQIIADLSNTPAANFYRIAFDPLRKRMALVVKHQAAE